MPLVYAAIVPHSLVLLPSVGKEKRETLSSTIESYAQIRQRLSEHRVETIVVIAPHSPRNDATCVMQHAMDFTASFEEFGDLVTQKQYKPDHVLIDYLKRYFDTIEAPWAYHNEEQIEYAASVPLVLLDIEQSRPIVVIYAPQTTDPHSLRRTGIALYDALATHNRRVAVLFSGDLAHTLSEDAPGGFAKDSADFDRKIITIFEKKKPNEILDIPAQTIEAIKTCAMPPLGLLSGLLANLSYEANTLSYEAPLGVGQLVMEYSI